MEESLQIEEPKRLQAFARFFKNYMSVSALITAALPIPVTSFQLIPTFHDQTEILSVYTSLFCFLLLGYIFFIRHFLAKLFFKHNVENLSRAKRIIFKSQFFLLHSLPLVFICLSLYSAIYYHIDLKDQVTKVERELIG